MRANGERRIDGGSVVAVVVVSDSGISPTVTQNVVVSRSQQRGNPTPPPLRAVGPSPTRRP